MSEHKEYGEGFVDGFNAALKSDYIKELYQAQDKEQYIKRINELEEQLDKIRTICYNITNGYQMYNIQQSILNQNQNMSLFDLANAVNAYRK